MTFDKSQRIKAALDEFEREDTHKHLDAACLLLYRSSVETIREVLQDALNSIETAQQDSINNEHN
jgi:hypothetical protein